MYGKVVVDVTSPSDITSDGRRLILSKTQRTRNVVVLVSLEGKRHKYTFIREYVRTYIRTHARTQTHIYLHVYIIYQYSFSRKEEAYKLVNSSTNSERFIIRYLYYLCIVLLINITNGK